MSLGTGIRLPANQNDRSRSIASAIDIWDGYRTGTAASTRAGGLSLRPSTGHSDPVPQAMAIRREGAAGSLRPV